jgi:hypothetical protein
LFGKLLLQEYWPGGHELNLIDMVKKKFHLLWCALLILFYGCGPGDIGGTYSFGDKDSRQAFGSIKIHPVSDNAALFFLDVNRGAPSYNMAQLYGRMAIDGSVGTYNSKVDARGSSCEITFKFSDKTVEVTVNPDKNGCGFGANVSISHVYRLTNDSIPMDYITAEGDTLLFERIKVEE